MPAVVTRVRIGRRCRPLPARGVSVLLVLALLSMTLAVGYAIIRSGTTFQQSQTNYQRLGDSRQAAYAGLSAALRRMQQNGWGGVESAVTGNLGAGVSYTATFATGDESLTPASPLYAEFPYRVTVISTGSAVDPINSAISSTTRVQAIVRLIPRKLYDPPAGWSGLQNYTLYHWSTTTGDTLHLDLPVRVEGPVLTQNAVELAATYPTDGDVLPFAGQIDEVAVIGRALSDAQILAVYQGDQTGIFTGTGHRTIARWRFEEATGAAVAQDQLDLYDGLYDGAKAGGAPAPVNGGNGSVTLDGVNDHVHLGNVDAPGNELTILAWLKPSSFPSEFGRIIAKASGPTTDEQYWTISHYLNNGRRSVRFRLKTYIGGTAMLNATNVNLVAGQWSFIAAVYDGAKMKVYQNGQLQNEMFKVGSIPSASDVFASIGASPSSSPRAKYLRDVQSLFASTGTDYRPFTAAITAAVSKTSAAERSLVTDELQKTWNDLTTTVTPPTHPGSVASYKLYPGGKSYPIPELGSTLRDQSFAPDPEVNPLGVVFRLGNLDVRDNVSITGVVIVNATDSTPDIEVYGKNVRFNSITLPQVDGSTGVTQLPAVVVKDDFRVYGEAQGVLNGLAVVWGELGFPSGAQNTQFILTGRAFVNEFYSQARTEWWRNQDWWKARLHEYFAQLTSANAVLYFPQWLQANHSLNPVPQIVIRPPQSGEKYHWPNWSQPIFVAHPSDGGLRWEILEVRELH